MSDAFTDHILITGASGGLGRALAAEYAAPGIRFSLWGRNRERLARTAEECQTKGAQVQWGIHDARDVESSLAAVRQLHESHPVDRAFLCAGVSSGSLPDGRPEPAEDAHRIMAVNGTATIGLGAALLELMLARDKGHLILFSSIAAFSPLPSSPAYCAAKSALSLWARATRLRLGPAPVRVSVVYPGYVDTPMSRRLRGPKPWCWSADHAARHIRRTLEAGNDSVAFPLPLVLGTKILNLLPDPLARYFSSVFAFTVEPDAESPASPSHMQPKDTPDA